MTGTLALVGSGAYLEVMETVDRRLLSELQRGDAPHVVCVPTATAQRGWRKINEYAELGMAHFERLGARVSVAFVTDRDSAHELRWAALLRDADLIYFTGGNPLYLYRTLEDTPAWEALQSAWKRGATLVGCSAGAMVMGQNIVMRMFNFRFTPAFGLLPKCIVWPHFNLPVFRRISSKLVRSLLTDEMYALGVDEDTAVFGKIGQEWEIGGVGDVCILTRDHSTIYSPGSRFTLPAFAGELEAPMELGTLTRRRHSTTP